MSEEPWTFFSIDDVPFPPSSLNSLSHIVKPFSGARKGQRNVNNKYRPKSKANARLYEYVVSGVGVGSPALGRMWPDAVFTVNCGDEIVQPAGTDLERDVVPGSLRYMDEDERWVESEEDAAWVCYCPRLTLVLFSIEPEFNEQGQEKSYTLTFEEVEAPEPDDD